MRRIWFLITIILIILSVLSINALNRRIEVIRPLLPKSPSRLNFGLKEPLLGWLVLLERNENCPFDGILDTNGEKSYGPFCYQEKTFLLFVRKYKLLPNTEDKEVINMIGDRDFQWLLTSMVFQDSLDHWIHWRTTATKKIGMPPGV